MSKLKSGIDQHYNVNVLDPLPPPLPQEKFLDTDSSSTTIVMCVGFRTSGAAFELDLHYPPRFSRLQDLILGLLTKTK